MKGHRKNIVSGLRETPQVGMTCLICKWRTRGLERKSKVEKAMTRHYLEKHPEKLNRENYDNDSDI